jgi:hypothetical protein
MKGTKRGSEAKGSFKPRRRSPQRYASDESAVAAARVNAAFATVLNASMGRLRMLYAARIAALALVSPGDYAAALIALTQERDAAMNQLRAELLQSRRRAIAEARRRGRRKPVPVRPAAVPTPRSYPKP